MMLRLANALWPVQEHPEIYAPFGEISGSTLATRLVLDITCLSRRATGAIRYAEWLAVGCKDDWIDLFRRDRSVEDCFRSFVPFPEGGVNAMHAEILLTAYAESVGTTTRTGPYLCIKGLAPEQDLINSVSYSLPYWRRLVMFRLG